LKTQIENRTSVLAESIMLIKFMIEPIVMGRQIMPI